MSKHFRLLLLSGLLLASFGARAYPFAYLPDYGSNSVNVIDVADNVQKGALAVSLPVAVEVLPDGKAVVVASGANALVIYPTRYPNPAQAAQGVTIPLNGTPQGLAVSPDGKHIWVSLLNSTKLLRLDAADPADAAKRGEVELGFYPGPLVASKLFREVVNGVNNYTYHVFAAARIGKEATKLTVLNDALPAPAAANWELSHPAAAHLAVSDSFQLFASHPAADQVSVLRADDGARQTPLAVAGAGALITYGSTLYVASPGEVKRWTLGTAIAPMAGIAVDGQPQRLSTDLEGGKLYMHKQNGDWAATQTQQSQLNLLNPPIFGRFVGPYPSVLSLDSATGNYDLNESTDASKILRVFRFGDLTSTPAFRIRTSDRGLDTNTDARAGQDYEALDAAFTFPEGERYAAIPLKLVNDAYYGNTEYLHLYLTEVSAPALNANGSTPVTLNIVNDDKDPREERNGCSTAGRAGRFDPSLPLLGLASAAVLLRRLRRRGH